MTTSRRDNVSKNVLVMPLLMSYGPHGDKDEPHMERLLLDSVAECCVCPKDYAPECPILPLRRGEGRNLVIVTGDEMNVYGYMYVHYTFPKGRWMLVHYYVCDAPYPAISVAGLCKYGYSVNFDYRRTPCCTMGIIERV